MKRILTGCLIGILLLGNTFTVFAAEEMVPSDVVEEVVLPDENVQEETQVQNDEDVQEEAQEINDEDVQEETQEETQELNAEEVAAANDVSMEETHPVGGISYNIEEISASEGEQLQTVDIETITSSRASTRYNDDWDVYSSNYFYNRLNANEKKVWDGMDYVCRTYLRSSADLSENSLLSVDTNDTDIDEMVNLWEMFSYSNPQYYFLSNSLSYYYDGEDGTLVAVLLPYDRFMSGTARTKATSEMQKAINSMKSQVDAAGSTRNKVLKIHDLICKRVKYDHEINNYGIPDYLEQERFSQSAYSALLLDKTVCSGYSQAFALIANACGIDAAPVTGSNHAWDRVRVENKWYNIDLTWDDDPYDGVPVAYDYFLRSDAFFDDGGHDPEGLYAKVMPAAKNDSNSSFSTPGKVAAASNTVATPKVTKTEKTSSGYKVTIKSSTSGVTYFYTTDGKNPSEAKSRSAKTNGTISLKSGKTLKVIAIKDGSKDSQVLTYDASGKVGTTKVTKVTNHSSGVKVCWNTATNAQGYYVYRKTGNGKWESIAQIKKANTTSYIDKKAKSGKTYSYTVCGYNQKSKGTYDKTGKKIKYLSVGKISSLKSNSNGVTIKWNKVNGAQGYYIYRKAANGKMTKIATVKGGTKVKYTDKSVKSKSGKYVYAVCAYSGKYTGAYKTKSIKR